MLNPRLIAQGPVFMPATSRDGSVMAWSNRLDETRDIFVQRGGETTRLTTDEEIDTEPTLTPEGDVLVWSRRVAGGDWDLYEANPQGEIRPLLAEPGAQRKPRFSADGSTLVFEDRGGIGIIREGEREWIARPEGNEDSRKPRINHDGSRVFWERFDAASRTTTLWMRDQNGAEKPLLTPDHSWTGYDINREGDRITYSVWTDEGEDLKVWDLGTNQVTELASKAGVNETFPAVSPDGESTIYNLVYFRTYPKVNAYIFRDKNGFKEELVTRHPTGRDLFPQVTPDGKHLHWMWIHDEDPNNRALMQAEL